MIGIADSAGIVGHGTESTELVQVQFARVSFIAAISDVSLSGLCLKMTGVLPFITRVASIILWKHLKLYRA